MFTGIIEELGRVRSVERRGEGVRMTVEARAVTEGTQEGDSVAVNGVCLTALDVRADSFAADGSRETLHRSTLGLLRAAPDAVRIDTTELSVEEVFARMLQIIRERQAGGRQGEVSA